MLTIALPLPSRKLCGNAKPATSRGGRFAHSDRVKRHRLSGRVAALATIRPNPGYTYDTGPLWPAGRVAVRVRVVYDERWATRPLDDDNLWRGCKAYLDGLEDAGVVANDRQFYHVGPVEWVKVPPGQPTGLVLRLALDDG